MIKNTLLGFIVLNIYLSLLELLFSKFILHYQYQILILISYQYNY